MGKKVLVIDPDFDSTKSLSQFLIYEGFQVIVSSDVEDGLIKIKSENPDLVIVEPFISNHKPFTSNIDGFDLCCIISKDFERKIPIIFLTKYCREVYHRAEAFLIFGASAYFHKPFQKEELLSTIIKLLGEKPGVENKKEKEAREQRFKTPPEKFLEDFQLESKEKQNKVDELFKNMLSEFSLFFEKESSSLKKTSN
jgi:DNA-binding response OmpR family regulator